MDNTQLRLVYEQLIHSAERGTVIAERLRALGQAELNDLFDGVIEGDHAELGRILEHLLKPVIEARLGSDMTHALLRAQGDD